MATKEQDKDPELDEREDAEPSEAGDDAPVVETVESSAEEPSSEDERGEATEEEREEAKRPAREEETGRSAEVRALGATKYVHAAFIGAGILGAYLAGKLLYTIWNALADWPLANRALPILLRYAEDDRETFSMVAGAIIGVIAVVQTYRKEHIRRWADEVATELSKVTWPDKEAVTNGTVVVVVASAIATVYVALLDRLWSFLTNLVYGA